MNQTLGTPSIVNDANITLTLGGTPTDSLLKPFSITVGWTGALSTARGGAPSGGTTGQVLKKNTNTSYDYAWAADATGGGASTTTGTGFWHNTAGVLDAASRAGACASR